jgi:phage I-like protein
MKSFTARLFHEIAGSIFAGVDDGELVEIQLAPFGEFDHPVYGRGKISEAMGDALIEYFNARPAREISTYCNHGSSKPAATDEQGKASGWIKRVFKKATGIFGMWKPTANAKKRVIAEEYKYFSPTLAWDYPDPISGATIPLALNAGGLTNRPFFEEMKPIEFSSVTAEDTDDSRTVILLADERTFQAVKTEDGNRYPAAAYAYVPDPEAPSTWKLRLWQTPELKVTPRQVGLAVAALGKGFRGQKVQLPADARSGVLSKVRAAWRKVNPDKSPDDMPGVLKASTASEEKMKDFLVLLFAAIATAMDKTFSVAQLEQNFSAADPEDPKPEEVAEFLAGMFKDFGEKASSLESANKKLKADLSSATSSKTNVEKELKDLTETVFSDRIDKVLDKAIRETRISPAERDFWKGQLSKDFDGVKAHLETADKKLDLKPKASGEDKPGRSAEEEMDQKAKELQKEKGGEEKFSYADAIAEVSRLNPELEKRYREETYARIEGKDL